MSLKFRVFLIDFTQLFDEMSFAIPEHSNKSIYIFICEIGTFERVYLNKIYSINQRRILLTNKKNENREKFKCGHVTLKSVNIYIVMQIMWPHNEYFSIHQYELSLAFQNDTLSFLYTLFTTTTPHKTVAHTHKKKKNL